MHQINDWRHLVLAHARKKLKYRSAEQDTTDNRRPLKLTAMRHLAYFLAKYLTVTAQSGNQTSTSIQN